MTINYYSMILQKVIDYIHSLNNSIDNETSIEVELKILIDSRCKYPKFIPIIPSNVEQTVRQIVDKATLYGNPEISQTINFIDTKSDHMYVKQLYYDNGVQNKSKKNCYIKKSLMQPIYMVADNVTSYPYKFSINQETVINESRDNFDIIRFRLRYSIVFQETSRLANWRMDLTFIKECNDNSINKLKQIRDKLFDKKINTTNFLDMIDWDYADRIELEFEYIGKLGEFNTDTIIKLDEILSHNAEVSKQSYDNCIVDIAKLLKLKTVDKFQKGQFGLKQLGPNPIELNRKLYFTDVLPTIDNFIITEKIDGTRTVIIIYPLSKLCYIINSNKDEFIAGVFTTDSQKSLTEIANDIPIILDTEAIKLDGIMRYYVFDIISHPNYKNIDTKPFVERLSSLLSVVEYANEIGMKIDGNAFLYNKHFVHLSKDTYTQSIQEFYTSMTTAAYKIDGLIFVEKTTKYIQTVNYKWKPIELMTIDFVAKKCPSIMLGISPYVTKDDKTLYLLFCGIQSYQYQKLGIEKFKEYTRLFSSVCDNQYGRVRDNYYPIQFSPSSDPYAYLFWGDTDDLDGKVIELSYDIVTNNWSLYKIRHDRYNDMLRKTYYGNYFKYAEHIWMNYKNPLTMDALCSGASGYFKNSDDRYFAPRKFNNYVKNQLIELHSKQISLDWAIDLCSGNGQDMDKYINCKFKNVLFTDVDYDGLTEIINRKYKYIDNKAVKNNCKIYIKHLDMSHPYKTNINTIYDSYLNIPVGGVPLVVCNLALHYFVPNLAKIRNFVNLLNKLLEPGGVFIFTAFNGNKVFDLLAQQDDGNWNKFGPDGQLLYSVKRNYTSDEFTGINQTIDVLLPFSNSQYYTENLINIDLLNAELAKKKIRNIADSSFDIYLNKFSKEKQNFYDKLTDDDKQYISLYNMYIYHKDNKTR